MRFTLLTLCLLVSFVIESPAAFIWQIGIDNNATPSTEMDPEFQADDFYYLDPGDYRNVRGYTGISTLAYGVDRSSSPSEVVADGSATAEGFERALTNSDVSTNIFFQLSSDQLLEGGLKFTVDFLKPALYADPAPGPAVDTPTDILVYFNGNVIGTIDDMVNASLYTFSFSNSSVNAVAGSNVISLVRTGEAVPPGWVSSYVVMDYLKLETAPEPSRALLAMMALCACFVRRRRQ